MKRTPINKISQKQKKRLLILSKLEKPELCEVCNRKIHLDWHHKEYRSQGGTDERENLVALCRICHTEVHGGEQRCLATTQIKY